MKVRVYKIIFHVHDVKDFLLYQKYYFTYLILS
jgi:hypothetical protein